jgi:PBP1b-binding outer membrane lipoprotein LpoB
MKNILFVFMIILFFGSCAKHKDTTNNESKLEEKTNVPQKIMGPYLNTPESPVIIPKEIIGTYLNTVYLDLLNETKSHTVAINKVHREYKIEIDEIIISEEKMLLIFYLHEGIPCNIISINNNAIVFRESQHKNVNKITLTDDNLLVYGDVMYRKITNDTVSGPSGKIGVKTYITSIIFGDKVYRNDKGDVLYCLPNGNILYKNKEYEFTYSYVFENQYYDKLCLIEEENSWPTKDCWIKMNGDEISVYNIQVPDDYDDIDWAIIGDFILVDTLKVFMEKE